VFRGDAFAHTPISCTFSDFLSNALAAADSNGGSSAPASPSQGTACAGNGRGASGGLGHDADRGADPERAASQQPATPERRLEPPQAGLSGVAGSNGTPGNHAAEGQHLYLAQAAIKSSAPGACSLAALQADIRLPACLARLPVDQINLWMSIECGCFPSQCPRSLPAVCF